jgi:hypothetical protein
LKSEFLRTDEGQTEENRENLTLVSVVTVNDVSVKQIKRANRKEKAPERVMKYCLRLLEID